MPQTAFNVPKRRFLVSVSDKRNLEAFRPLIDSGNWECISTGGTYKELRRLSIPCSSVESLTGMPEMLGGRLKTLHPLVLGPTLARPGNFEDMNHLRIYAEGIGLPPGDVLPIELVVMNFYPFREALEKFKRDEIKEAEVIENIDIGGPALVRAAAKACFAEGGPLVVVRPEHYQMAVEALLSGAVTQSTRKLLVYAAIAATADYDMHMANWLISRLDGTAF